jgi:hypothetical protein
MSEQIYQLASIFLAASSGIQARQALTIAVLFFSLLEEIALLESWSEDEQWPSKLIH